MNIKLFSRMAVLLLAAFSGQAVCQLRMTAPQSPPTFQSVSARSDPRLVDRVVAIVNSEAITELELQRKTEAIVRRLRGQGTDLPPIEVIKPQVLERMVSDLAVQQAARDLGIRVDEAIIDRAVGRIAQDANLSVAQFRDKVEAEGGIGFSAFRQEVANELIVSRIREREIDARVQVSEAEINAYLEEQKSAAPEFNISQILVRVPEGASAAEVARLSAKAETIARGARTGVDFSRILASYEVTGEPVVGGNMGMRRADQIPPIFMDAVSGLVPGDVAPVVRSQAGFHVLKLVERRGGDGGSSAAPVRQTRARHILIRINELNSEPEVLRRLNEIRERLTAKSVEFPDMARQYSADGSASQGGDLGWVYPGDTVPEFENAMNVLKPGEISEPVRSPFGYHLIQVVDRRTDEASPERVRAAARGAIRTRKSNEAFAEWVAQARDRAYVEYRLDER